MEYTNKYAKKHLFLRSTLIDKLYISYQELTLPAENWIISPVGNYKLQNVQRTEVSKYSVDYYMHNTACIINHNSFSW